MYCSWTSLLCYIFILYFDDRTLDGSKFPWNGKSILGICHDSSFEIIFEQYSRIVTFSIDILRSPGCSYELKYLFNHLSQYDFDLFVNLLFIPTMIEIGVETIITQKLLVNFTINDKETESIMLN